MERSVVADPLVGQLVDGRYRVGAKIARGGMATVYEATDLRLDRRVALKVMPHALSDNDEFAQRFVREARAAARLTHPNVVAVYDQGDDEGVLFLAMEYVDGRATLRDLIRSEAPLSPGRALRLLEEILKAIAAAHESGIIHRDIKPENVLIGPRGQVKVADFGLARAISSATAATATGGVLMGTVSYLPPELVIDGTSDARSDVYALGVMLFELLTGTKPHEGDNPIQVAYKHVHDDVPPPSSVIGGIPPYLDALVARATSRQRDLRPADAHVMLQQLRRVRLALEAGVRDDPELTDDLTPTVAIAGVGSGPHLDPMSSADEVFDQEAFTPGERTLVVGSAAYHPAGGLASPSPAGGWDDGSVVRAAATPPRRRRRRTGLVAFVLVLLLAAGAAAAGWFYGVGRFQQTPDVVHLTQSAAQVKLKAAGLSLKVVQTAYSETVPDGRLISTNPGPGDKVADGGIVSAVISKGPERHDVPDLSGLTRSAAVKTLTQHSLRVGKVTRPWSEHVVKGQVIGFTPKAGTPLKPHSPVALVVSNGPAPIRIPSFAHQSADAAKAALGRLGFVVDEHAVYNDNIASGVVVEQRPAHGVGHRGDHISLVVSKGPHLVPVPDVIDAGVTSATETLHTAGFAVTVHHNEPYFGLGFVVSQSTDGGAMAPYGSTIIITIV